MVVLTIDPKTFPQPDFAAELAAAAFCKQVNQFFIIPIALTASPCLSLGHFFVDDLIG